MPDISQYNTQEEWMKVCVPQCMTEGLDNEQAVGKCMGMWNDKNAAKNALNTAAVKAVGDWELDVNPVPFGSRQLADSDGQWFDSLTDIMDKAFNTPLVTYQHGFKRGARGMEEKPVVIGNSVPNTLEKQADGWHVRVLLDKTKQAAKDIMDSAYKSAVAVSSDSISHLARLDIGGKLIQYEKNRSGRIAVWPLAGFSLWEMGNGNFKPANRMAVALPAMKAMYREAGLSFPELDTLGGELYALKSELRRAKIRELKEQATEILKQSQQTEE